MTATDTPSTPTQIAVIIPVGTLEGAKTRLGETLDAEERLDLVERLLARTVGAALAVERLADVLVISPDRDVLHRAADLGARTLRQRSVGLNAGLEEARADVIAGGADAILVLPIDLALVSPPAIETLLDALSGSATSAASTTGRPVVVLVSDRHGTGTNALAVRPPDAIEFAFGPGSRAAHRGAAEAAGAACIEPDSPLSIDIDTPADLVLAESLAPEEIGAG